MSLSVLASFPHIPLAMCENGIEPWPLGKFSLCHFPSAPDPRHTRLGAMQMIVEVLVSLFLFNRIM